jgi:hypothetical protein
MSYKLFDQGYTAKEISKMHKPTQEERIQEEFRKWSESEHVLNILRTIKASRMDLDRMELALWRKATKRR